MTSPASQIADAVIAAINAMAPQPFNYVRFDEVRLQHSDFDAHELPAIQFVDNNMATVRHIRGEIERDWNIVAEIVAQPPTVGGGAILQKQIWDLRRDVERALFENPKLGLSFVETMYLDNSFTDLHTDKDEPYTSTIEFRVRFRDELVGTC